VNSIIAGFPASKSVLNHPVMMEKIRPHTLNARMIKRDMLPGDLCGAAVFLASDASGFITKNLHLSDSRRTTSEVR
jgi:hypothetical protein